MTATSPIAVTVLDPTPAVGCAAVRTSPPPLTAVIPLKAGPTAKSRLAESLGPQERLQLLSRTFQRAAGAALEARSVHRVVAVVGDPRARTWAARMGVEVVEEPAGQPGLRAAIAAADRLLGAATTLVLPADLPLVEPADLDAVAGALPDVPGVVVAPTADGGTGALLRAPGGVIAPCYGPGSAAAHLDAAQAAGVSAAQVWLPGLALDIDRPDDLGVAREAAAWSGGRYDPLPLPDSA